MLLIIASSANSHIRDWLYLVGMMSTYLWEETCMAKYDAQYQGQEVNSSENYFILFKLSLALFTELQLVKNWVVTCKFSQIMHCPAGAIAFWPRATLLCSSNLSLVPIYLSLTLYSNTSCRNVLHTDPLLQGIIYFPQTRKNIADMSMGSSYFGYSFF